VRVASERYGFKPGDRVYQGMTIAFDFSVEEIWVPLMTGATLVPGPPGVTLLGDELADFLRERKVTGLCCCPTLLGTIETELPQLRLLLVGGEACPHNLVVRWHRPRRTILKSYGPTEATVTATLAELTPDRPVTIGLPLPTYSIIILDPAADHPAAPGALGEIGIAGIGLAAAYLNREELTRKKFIADFLAVPNNPSIGPATSAASTRKERSSITAASTLRSRSAATGSSSSKSNPYCWICRRLRKRW
jgi:non-ribosomal peptide synthetase component F